MVCWFEEARRERETGSGRHGRQSERRDRRSWGTGHACAARAQMRCFARVSCSSCPCMAAFLQMLLPRHLRWCAARAFLELVTTHHLSSRSDLRYIRPGRRHVRTQRQRLVLLLAVAPAELQSQVRSSCKLYSSDTTWFNIACIISRPPRSHSCVLLFFFL
jgi:hypothetical protein